MTQSQAELVELAVPYALDALSESERIEVEGKVAAAGSAVADDFYDEVRAVRETMALISVATAQEPPAGLRRRLIERISEDEGSATTGGNVRPLRSPCPGAAGALPCCLRQQCWRWASARSVSGCPCVHRRNPPPHRRSSPLRTCTRSLGLSQPAGLRPWSFRGIATPGSW